MKRKTLNRFFVSATVLLLAGLILAACGNETTSTPQPKELTKDRLLFLSNRDGWPDLYTMDQSGKVIQRLTESAAAEYGAVWSPDGKQVAFTELEGDQANGDYARVRRVVTIDADGKNRKVIANDAFNPQWSPDSTKILFVRSTPNGNATATGEANPGSERYSANIRALPPNQVAPRPSVSPSPAASSRPGGSPAASVSATPRPGGSASPGTTSPTPAAVSSIRPANPGAGSTSVVPTGAPTFGDSSGAVKNVTLPPGFVPPQLPGVTVQATVAPPPSPATGPTTSNSRYKGGLYIAPTDGSAAVKNGTPVLLVADNAVEGRWSPDGTKIAYLAGSNDLSQPRSLYLMNPDGSNKTSLSQQAKLDNLDVLQIAWSPDGQALAFSAVDFSRDRIGLYRLTMSNNTVRRLTDYNGSARDLTGLIWAYDDYFNPASRLHFGPVWSLNSRRIAFADGSNTISVVEADNGNRTSYPVGAAALGQDKDSVLNVAWLPDNRRIIYDRADAGRTALLTEANYYIFDFFSETLETLDTVNKNTNAIAGPGASFFTTQCCGVDLLGSTTDPASPTATVKPTATIGAINGSKPEGKLVYTSGVGQRQLIVNDLKTHDRTILSSGLFKLLDFSLSPRNDRLVYLEVGEKYNATLYLSSLDGKQKRKLSEGTGEPDDLSSVVLWSPDGRQVAFQVLKGDPTLKPGLYVLTVDAADNASAPRLLTDMQVSGFSWSPDSRQIAFKVDNNYYELWTVSVEGGPSTAKQLSQLGVVNPNYASLGKGVAWSPSGQWIAATGPTNFSRFALWLVNTNTGKVAEIQSNVIARIVGWTPDSSRVLAVIASFSQNTDVQAYNLNLDRWRPYGNGGGPQISPDGFFFAYYSRQDLRLNNGAYSPTSPTDQPGRLMISQVSNGDLRPIPLDFSPYFGFKARFFAWSPDGRILAYYYNNSIFGVGPDGQNPQVLGRAFTIDKLGWVKG
jgi:Tol biopolymer transport system component